MQLELVRFITCFKEFMRELLHTFSKDVIKGIKYNIIEKNLCKSIEKTLKCQLVTKSKNPQKSAFKTCTAITRNQVSTHPTYFVRTRHI